MKLWSLAILVFLAVPTSASQAATPLVSASVSSDVTIVLGGVIVDDEDVAADNLAGIIIPVDLGDLPETASVNSYHLLENGDQLFSLDTTVTLTGPVTAEPGRRGALRRGLVHVEFDASANGVPNGVVTDAMSTTTAGDLLLSFDTTVELSAASGTVAVDDEDLVSFNGSVFSRIFDGSGVGVAEALDVDGAHDLGGGKLAMSFDGSGSLSGVNFDDEDVLGVRHGPVRGKWLTMDRRTMPLGALRTCGDPR